MAIFLPSMTKRAGYLSLLCLLACPSFMATAGIEAFKSGTVIKDYGKVAEVKSSLVIPKGMTFKVAFDLAKAANPGELNRSIETLARFINMHVAAGVKLEDISLAMVVHGQAASDLTQQRYYQMLNAGQKNANADLIAQLVKHGVKFYVCGQTAAYYGITPDELLPGVDMALSALTAHAVLAHEGYSVNPF
ncbi:MULTISPECIES: DsrE family protein [Shewanella]|uniref:DsrE family protein n=1 Tax=Shewanella TaxID=22 RepID=UPI00200F5B26|nr:DsrE family protein [Shewanella basaltis]MCL1114977.1 DsrE family protein [Shewanella basaltis]